MKIDKDHLFFLGDFFHEVGGCDKPPFNRRFVDFFLRFLDSRLFHTEWANKILDGFNFKITNIRDSVIFSFFAFFFLGKNNNCRVALDFILMMDIPSSMENLSELE